VLRALPLPVKDEIARQRRLLARFPCMYQIIGGGRFRRHRRFLAGDWLIYYCVVENTVYIRGLWPARIP
jgi:hypothetical protein